MSVVFKVFRPAAGLLLSLLLVSAPAAAGEPAGGLAGFSFSDDPFSDYAFTETEEAPSEMEEQFAPPVTDEDGRYQVWDLEGQVCAWIPMPYGFYADEEFTTRNALVLWPTDTDSLNADASYYVYDMEDGYLDLNMDDPLEEEAQILSMDEELTVTGPTPAETFQAADREMSRAMLQVAYTPDDAAPAYTTEYLIWIHLDERTIVVCHTAVTSANPESPFTLEEAGTMFLSSVSLE